MTSAIKRLSALLSLVSFIFSVCLVNFLQNTYLKTERMRKMINCLYVGFGGFMGTLLRYLIGKLFIIEGTNLPVTTFLINSSGALLIGIISAADKNTDYRITLLCFCCRPVFAVALQHFLLFRLKHSIFCHRAK